MKRVNAIASLLGAAFCFAMVLLITANIIGRKLGNPVPGAVGLAGFMLATVVFLGLSRCEETESHIRVEFLLYHLPPKLRAWVTVFDYLVALLVFGAMVWATGIDTLRAWQIKQMLTAVIMLPEYPVKTIVTLGCGLMFIQLAINTIGFIRQRRVESRAEKVRKEFA